jgi:hypothetical protein
MPSNKSDTWKPALCLRCLSAAPSAALAALAAATLAAAAFSMRLQHGVQRS